MTPTDITQFILLGVFLLWLIVLTVYSMNTDCRVTEMQEPEEEEEL